MAATTQLPHLPDVQRLSPRVIRILGGNPGKFTLQGTNTYLLGTGHTRILIDTGEGTPTWRTRLSSLLTSESCTISHALLTHWHVDHVSGVPDLLTLCPAAEVCKHNPSWPSSSSLLLADGSQEVNQTATITDGEIFSVEGATLRALHCPGHTTDHMAFILEEEEGDGGGAMFTGDNVLGHGTAVFESLAVYLASLARMKECGGDKGGRAYPGHGDIVADRNAKIEEYILHRRRREGEILSALMQEREGEKVVAKGEGKGEGKTAMDIVEVVYKDYPRNLWEPASAGVMQVLWKLQDEGKVREIGGGKWAAFKSTERSTL